jgi:hypothetical protein
MVTILLALSHAIQYVFYGWACLNTIVFTYGTYILQVDSMSFMWNIEVSII